MKLIFKNNGKIYYLMNKNWDFYRIFFKDKC